MQLWLRKNLPTNSNGIISFVFISIWQDNGWIRNFEAPKQFSKRTMMAIQSNKKINITDAVCIEIVQALVTLAMVHSQYPTPQEYTILAEKLVTKFPILADSYGCGFVS